MNSRFETEHYETINNTIDYYKNLQLIKQANTCENKILDYELKTTRIKLKNIGINANSLTL